MTDYGKLYDEYLYDCYIANQHLTNEDWQYYGRENHHIEIPNCDGGLLTPLNSQPLTTYQHWVAGVLQSEVLGRLCFAFTPAGVLPDWIDKLRNKWRVHASTEFRANAVANTTHEQRSAAACKWNAAKTPEERSESARKREAAMTPEQRFERQQRGWEKRRQTETPEQRSEQTRKAWETRRHTETTEERSEKARRRQARRTPEERSATARKSWETRRRNAQQQ